jgi:hypothetical protein
MRTMAVTGGVGSGVAIGHWERATKTDNWQSRELGPSIISVERLCISPPSQPLGTLPRIKAEYGRLCGAASASAQTAFDEFHVKDGSHVSPVEVTHEEPPIRSALSGDVV